MDNCSTNSKCLIAAFAKTIPWEVSEAPDSFIFPLEEGGGRIYYLRWKPKGSSLYSRSYPKAQHLILWLQLLFPQLPITETIHDLIYFRLLKLFPVESSFAIQCKRVGYQIVSPPTAKITSCPAQDCHLHLCVLSLSASLPFMLSLNSPIMTKS